MDTLKTTTKLILNSKAWGPALIFGGIYTLVFSNVADRETVDPYFRIATIFLCSIITLAGIIIMFKQLRTITTDSEDISIPEASEDLEHAITQLSKNYEILRRQTVQGFLLASIFMTLGFLVIIVGSLGELFGFTNAQGNLTIISGILLEFISGTALLIYRLNFKQLNKTSEKLHHSWKYLTAFRKVDGLEGDKKTDTIISLITNFVREK